MNTTIKTLFVMLVITFVIACFGLKYPQYHQVMSVGSPTGSTFNSPKFAGVVVNLANIGTNGTSTSITNTDTSDRYITGFRTACEGVGTSQTAYTGAGLANLQETIATTSASNPAALAYNAAVALNFNIATGTINYVAASSTMQTATTTLATVWPTGTPITFWFNATNTAICTTGVDYIGS